MSDDPARQRFAVLSALRLGGVLAAMFGLLVVQDVVTLPHAIGYVFVLLGLFGVFFLPLILARKWRTPKR